MSSKTLYERILQQQQNKQKNAENTIKDLNKNVQSINKSEENIKDINKRLEEPTAELQELKEQEREWQTGQSQMLSPRQLKKIGELQEVISIQNEEKNELIAEKDALQQQNKQNLSQLEKNYSVTQNEDGTFELGEAKNLPTDRTPKQLEIIKNISEGKPVSNEDLKELNKDDLEILEKEKMEGYDYNISNGFNDSLTDIRNYNNFRSTYYSDTPRQNFTSESQRRWNKYVQIFLYVKK